jgi:arylsulfatase A-like enzyme
MDVLGSGDIGINGASRVKTIIINKLASKGINFIDTHSLAARCTPSHYYLLTGSYPFRNKIGILDGDAPLIINTETRTISDMLQDTGYTTGIGGK